MSRMTEARKLNWTNIHQRLVFLHCLDAARIGAGASHYFSVVVARNLSSHIQAILKVMLPAMRDQETMTYGPARRRRQRRTKAQAGT
jgi:hypothetical protein